MNWSDVFTPDQPKRKTLQQAVQRQKMMEDDLSSFMSQRSTANDPWSALAHVANAGVKGYFANQAEEDVSNQWGSMFEPDPETGEMAPLFAGLSESQIKVLQDLGPEQGYSLLAQQAFKAPAERWEEVTDETGRVLGQRNTVTGETKADPRASSGRPMSVPRGGVLIDPATGQVIYQDQRSASGGEAPSNVREYQYFMSLSPEERRQFLTVKRANPYLNLGDVYAQPDPLSPGQMMGEVGVGIRPEREISDGQIVTMPGVRGSPRLGADSGGNLPPGWTPASGGEAVGPPATMPSGTAPVIQDIPEEGELGGVRVQQLPASPKLQKARESLSRNLSGLADVYLKLDELGGVVNPDRSAMENLSARWSASGLGQLAGQSIGTEVQSVRERINNMRPLLVQTIRQATEMSARGMDSNRELEFYLQAATSPEKDVYSNLAAIQVLDQTFGLGNVLQSTLPPEVYQRVKEQASIDMARRPIVITADQLEDEAQQGSPQAPHRRRYNPATGQIE
jgi:hypothetical protein